MQETKKIGAQRRIRSQVARVMGKEKRDREEREGAETGRET